jgi:Helix-turn-helix family
MGGSQMATDSSVYARVERLYSPLWLTTVFSPQVDAEFEALGLHPLERYFEHPEGRPLFAGYAALPWPEDRYLQLWHAHYLLREFRGDGHISILASEGLSGLEALLLHIAWTPALGPCSVPREAGPTTSGTEPPTSSEAPAGSAGMSSSHSHQPGVPIGNGSRPARTTATPRPTGRPPTTTWRSSPRSARRSGTPCAPTAPACSATSSRTTSRHDARRRLSRHDPRLVAAPAGHVVTATDPVVEAAGFRRFWVRVPGGYHTNARAAPARAFCHSFCAGQRPASSSGQGMSSTGSA